MNFEVLTLFPEMIGQAVGHSVIGRALNQGLISVDTINIRDYSCNRHMRVDDYPYGGGAGMVMEAEPVYRAVEEARRRAGQNARVVYLTPQAEVLTQTKVEELACEDSLILLCGHYEGIDERVLAETVTDYISIGDYVLTGGELGALVLIDAVSRFVPGVLGNDESADFESLQDCLLEYPHYTRPEVWHDTKVPDVLLSGDHGKVEKWRREQSLIRTRERRPDLLKRSRNVRTIWYGDERAGAMAELLTERLTRHGAIENYNRKTMQKRRNEFGRQDLLILVAEPDAVPAEVRFRNLTGDGTPFFLFSTIEDETAIKETVPFLEKRGMKLCGSFSLDFSDETDSEGAVRRAALSIRRMMEKGEL